MTHPIHPFQPLLFFIFTSLLCARTLAEAAAVPVTGSDKTESNTNPFTPRASLLRYWSSHFTKSVPIPSFLLSKASPLTAIDAAAFSKLASSGSLASHLPSFCSAAGLLCFPDLQADGSSHHGRDANFTSYINQNFTNYGTSGLGGQDSFKNYSYEINSVFDNFRRYGLGSIDRDEGFDHYAQGSNVVDQSFSTYGNGDLGGNGRFDNYNEQANITGLNFKNYVLVVHLYSSSI